MLAFFFEACYNMRVIKRNARCFRLVTSLSSSFSPLSYMDRAQNRKALCPIHFCREKKARACDVGACSQAQGKEKKAAQAQGKEKKAEMPAKKQKEARAPLSEGARAGL